MEFEKNAEKQQRKRGKKMFRLNFIVRIEVEKNSKQRLTTARVNEIFFFSFFLKDYFHTFFFINDTSTIR